MSAIETSLAAMKEASSLAKTIPYISPVAGLLLQALAMRDEVKQHKDEWDVVMRKLGRVAGLVVNVGESCQKYNLQEKDLPPGLRTILQTLQTGLSGVESALKQSVEVGVVRRVLFRKDLLRKVKQYDGELSNVLQTFQAELALDARFAQIAEELKVTQAGPPAPSNRVMSMAQEPRSPQIFFGRDAELAEIIHMIFTHIGSHPAHIAILGPGGYGKTTLANAVLTHHRVQEHFGNGRYFVACESVNSSGSLLVELAKALGVLDEGSDASWSHIRNALNTKDTILCLDNFESPWEQADDAKHSVEELLSRITGLQHVTVLITVRGTVRPAQTHWTQPLLAPLQTLNHDAAREVWKQITGIFDDAAEELIQNVDFVPLAVNLLAHLAQATSPALLLKDWNQKQTSFIQIGQNHRLSNLEYSIQLSIDSARMRANPSARDLLVVLGMLPDGIHTRQLERFQEILGDMDILFSLRTLEQCSLIMMIGERYQTHPIIRHFCNHQSTILPKHENSLQEFYINLASSDPSEAQAKKYAEMVLEVNNTKAMLSFLLKSNRKDDSKLVKSILTFTSFHASIGDLSDKLISQTVAFLQQRHLATSLLIRCFQTWGRLYYFANDFENAKYKVQEAEKQCSSGPDNNSSLHADVLRHLSELHMLQGALEKAKDSFQKALEIHQITNDTLGQGNDYRGLGHTYIRLGKLQEAEASYQKALELHKMVNNLMDQGNDYKGLGDVYLRLNKLDEAEASFKKALEFHEKVNSALGQGNDYEGLGDTYIRLKKLHDAESSYQKALDLQKRANNPLGQGSALHGLGRVYMGKSQLGAAKRMFEMALFMHRQAQAPIAQERDQKYLNKVLSKMKQTTQK
ncbi:hypothetical protein B0F90DRAFT_1819896 [Multifurca ochricompacta]|uniref:ORC1/DEAH AAA+ ATPase domain-containing protein n=1 Tax=Multifurca ochricompacta TaxID=376703 RepID=A0AAD4QK75_9AGAM|nr:hypothetical protein B0F90DRAFT_1819896 [Multifurca ochricompacta]